MRERPILFSTPMVQANQAERKTETRRGRNLKEINENPNDWSLLVKLDDSICWADDDAAFLNEGEVLFIKNPYGQPGDLLWVRETFAPALGDFAYKADYINEVMQEKRNKGIWKPSIHMPKAAARIWLMIESVGLERLQDITEGGAIAEGVITNAEGFHDYEAVLPFFPLARDSFYSLWRSINGRYSTNSDPWVWVVKYRVLSKTGKPEKKIINLNYNYIHGISAGAGS